MRRHFVTLTSIIKCLVLDYVRSHQFTLCFVVYAKFVYQEDNAKCLAILDRAACPHLLEKRGMSPFMRDGCVNTRE